MAKFHMHTYRVRFTMPRRISDSLGELLGYDSANPEHHDVTVRIVAPPVGYVAAERLVAAYVAGQYHISSYQNLVVEKAAEPVEIDSILQVV